MRAASVQPSSYLESRESIRSRAVSLLFALAITALIVFLMIVVGALPIGKPRSQPALVVMQLPGLGSQASKAPKADKAPAVPHSAAYPVKAQAIAKPTSRPAHTSTPVPWNVIPMTSSEFAASDISTIPTHHEEHQTTPADDDRGGAPAADQIFDGYFAHSPTVTQLRPYMPRVMRDGYGEIICVLNANRHLEDCKESGETPGSGYARMMRQSAWQYDIVPPRINGHPVLGIRVRVHYDFTGFDKADPG